MQEYLLQYALFLAKTITWVVAVTVLVALVVNLVRQAREYALEHLDVKNVNERLRHLGDILNGALLNEHDRKRHDKQRKAEERARQKAEKDGTAVRRARVFVLDFHGDIRASQVAHLREEVSALLQVALPADEVVLRLESEGGQVHGYGLAASQLRRVRDKGIKLTVAVDKVAASGGYLMACVADRVLAAPFAIVGSIGVVGQLPNFSRWLQKNEIDYELHTAGEFKRTLTVFGENTAAAREKFREELEEVHQLFKAFVAQHRPQLALAQVATGEHWFGTRALELKLIDELRTSDDYLLQRCADADIYEVQYKHRLRLSERIAQGVARLAAVARIGRMPFPPLP